MTFGLKIVQSALAVVLKSEWTVQRHPTTKRRRRWAVQRQEYMAPGIIRMGYTLYVHPTIYADLTALPSVKATP